MTGIGEHDQPTPDSLGRSYTPRPGTVPFRVLAYLETLEHGAEVSTSGLSAALNLPVNNVMPCLMAALAAGKVFRRQKDDSHPRSPFFWSLVDHGPGRRHPSVPLERAPRKATSEPAPGDAGPALSDPVTGACPETPIPICAECRGINGLHGLRCKSVCRLTNRPSSPGARTKPDWTRLPAHEQRAYMVEAIAERHPADPIEAVDALVERAAEAAANAPLAERVAVALDMDPPGPAPAPATSRWAYELAPAREADESFRCCVWMDGTVEVRRANAPPVLFTAEEARSLVAVLRRIGVPS